RGSAAARRLVVAALDGLVRLAERGELRLADAFRGLQDLPRPLQLVVLDADVARSGGDRSRIALALDQDLYSGFRESLADDVGLELAADGHEHSSHAGNVTCAAIAPP